MNGVVLSDLHLFASRSDTQAIDNALAKLHDALDFIVLNGDIIDFRWSIHRSESATIEAGHAWLDALSSAYPMTHIYYVMGNHDCSIGWAEALKSLKSERFDWSPSHLILGENLFLHGDLPLRDMNPFERPLVHSHKHPPKMMDHLYQTAVRTKIHKRVSDLHAAEKCVPKIESAIRKHSAQTLDEICDIYFGHTHAPFSDFTYKGLRFHNTGSAIQHLDLNAVRFSHDTSE